MSKRTTTRVTYEFTGDSSTGWRDYAPSAGTLQRWIDYKWQRQVEVTEISRETVKGPKTGRQEAFESRWHACLHAVGVGGVEAHDEYSRPDAEVNQFIAEALKAEIDKMEENR